MRPTLLLQDLHIPWMHPDALDFCKAVQERYKLDQIISVGDEMDYASISFHSHDPDMPSPGDELAMAMPIIEKWRKAFPKMRIAKSNHGDLPKRKLMDSGLSEKMVKSYNDLYKTPGWSWHDEIVEDMHGIPLIVRHDFGANLKTSLGKVGDACIAYGHRHTLFGVHYRANLRYRQWAMCAGCLIDPSHRAFSYGRGTLDRPMLGVGVVIDGQATPVPMWTKTNGRWMGKIS
jgi:hypothetical protein